MMMGIEKVTFRNGKNERNRFKARPYFSAAAAAIVVV